MAQVIGKWILDETITPPKMDSTATFTFEKIIVVMRRLPVILMLEEGLRLAEIYPFLGIPRFLS